MSDTQATTDGCIWLHPPLATNQKYRICKGSLGGFLKMGGYPQIIQVMNNNVSIETHGFGIPSFKKPLPGLVNVYIAMENHHIFNG